VDETLDGGPILLQQAVPVLDGDDEETLAQRILVEEHRLYPEAVRLLLTGRVERSGRVVKWGGG
jgi:phosphoribosylglycinamide formyltransferase-1